MDFYRIFGTGILALALVGCSSTMKAVKPDATSGFPTKTALTPEEIIVNEKLDLASYKRLVYVQTGEKGEQYESFIVDSVKNIGYFERVVNKQAFEQELIASGKSDEISNISDLIGLKQATKAYGNFLVVKTNVEWLGGYDFVASIMVIDPVSGKTVYHAKRKAFNWAGLDKPLFYPLFNGFLSWVNTNKTAAAP